MAASDQIAVPAQHRVRSHQQPQTAQHVEGQTVQQRSQERVGLEKSSLQFKRHVGTR
ncbi:hypothetical protein [Streptomyces sp. NBC_00063]|uniref:hypothetical protein n=1 Tax=Streptomyces sp. NBC_00063 TaxID=2975638 RepID=UPI00225C38DD|nr:hypothetical protein [Streptomyces sp. NBC_00063]MCX5440909.1 hypothetical protein [Streptomyces sp. NBC_00063]